MNPNRNPDRALAYARRHRVRFVDELKRLVRFPTVSSQPERAADFIACTKWLARHLREIGFRQVRIVPTRRHPIVYAAWRGAERAPTLLLYGHYDVQPAEPATEWANPPFEPVIRGHRLYGRGASDDKGQLLTHLKAIESWFRTTGRLPVNIKCIFEGDEEQGSPGLEAFVDKLVARNPAALSACGALISDTRMIAPNQPTIGYAQRGNVRFRLEVRGATRELHSGNFGGAVANPLEGLCAILASLHDADGRISVPGIYSQVRNWPASERAYMEQAGPTDDEILRDARVQRAWGEPGFSLYERTTIRPALTVNNIAGGYTGAGIKTVIPPRAVGKFSVRTVPDQTADAVEQMLQRHVARVTPRGLKSKVRVLAATNPLFIERSNPLLQVAAFACEKGFGTKPVFLRSGGSVGGASVFHKVLGIPTVLLGFALPQDNVHARDESFDLSNFFRGIDTSIWFLAAVSHLRQVCAERAPHREPVYVRQTDEPVVYEREAYDY